MPCQLIRSAIPIPSFPPSAALLDRNPRFFYHEGFFFSAIAFWRTLEAAEWGWQALYRGDRAAPVKHDFLPFIFQTVWFAQALMGVTLGCSLITLPHVHSLSRGRWHNARVSPQTA